MIIMENRDGIAKVVAAYFYHDEIVELKLATPGEIYKPASFCDILWINYLRDIATKGIANVKVEIIATDADSRILNTHMSLMNPRWQGKPFDAEFDKRHNPLIACVETGETYRSVNSAAKETGLAAPSLNNAIRFPAMRKTVGGFRWVRVPEQE